ncbi:hypothetical protein BGY98DRAFT_1006266 [Russula aff. rugulosa BPL654]|nr:hypothetical protein BGY98DRAFT_1006266 [Russula aff. rugulosa BPL654]
MVFDKTSFCRAVNEDGRAYQYQAIELIKICRAFSTASHQSPDQDTRLQSVLEACDTALAHAVNSHKKTLGPTGLQFDMAIRKLHEYERDFHPNIKGPSQKPKDPRDKKYLTLAQNPHFYDGLPIFPTASVDTFKTQPTEDYQGTIYVLTNNERRVFLELGKKRRTFDNVWKMNDTLIFKDIIGYLEGEAIVRECIPPLPLSWSRMVHPESQLKVVGDIKDWRAPIFELLDSPFIRIHIKIKCH